MFGLFPVISDSQPAEADESMSLVLLDLYLVQFFVFFHLMLTQAGELNQNEVLMQSVWLHRQAVLMNQDYMNF